MYCKICMFSIPMLHNQAQNKRFIIFTIPVKENVYDWNELFLHYNLIRIELVSLRFGDIHVATSTQSMCL